MLKTRINWIPLIVLLSGCAGASRGPTPEEGPIPVSQPENAEPHAINIPSSRVWRLTPDNQPAQYKSIIRTQIQQLSNPEGSDQKDSLVLQASYTIGFNRNADVIAIEGSLSSFSIETGQRIGGDQTSLISPLVFKGELANHEIHLQTSTSSNTGTSSSPVPCGVSAQTALASIQRNVLTMPLEITIGTFWQDSISAVTCNGSLPVNLIDKKDYKVIGETDYRGVKVLVITRNEKALFYGEGSQDQHRIVARGETLGTGQLYVDQTTGSLLNVTANNKTTVSIETSGRVQQFLQTSSETTTRGN